MKVLVSPGGRWTIGLVPAGCTGVFRQVNHGDGFPIGLPPTRSRGQRDTDRFSGRKLDDGVLHRGPLITTRRWRNWIMDGAIDLRLVVSIAGIPTGPRRRRVRSTLSRLMTRERSRYSTQKSKAVGWTPGGNAYPAYI